MDHDVYPMPLFPRFTVRDAAVSTAFYCDVLGFEEVFAMPGGGMSHVRYRTYADVMLAEGEPPTGPVGRGVEVYLTLESGSVDDVAARAREVDADVEGPTETPWNTREVTVTDPDGYVLVFAQQTADPDPLPWLEEGTAERTDGESPDT